MKRHKEVSSRLGLALSQTLGLYLAHTSPLPSSLFTTILPSPALLSASRLPSPLFLSNGLSPRPPLSRGLGAPSPRASAPAACPRTGRGPAFAAAVLPHPLGSAHHAAPRVSARRVASTACPLPCHASRGRRSRASATLLRDPCARCSTLTQDGTALPARVRTSPLVD